MIARQLEGVPDVGLREGVRPMRASPRLSAVHTIPTSGSEQQDADVQRAPTATSPPRIRRPRSREVAAGRRRSSRRSCLAPPRARGLTSRSVTSTSTNEIANRSVGDGRRLVGLELARQLEDEHGRGERLVR